MPKEESAPIRKSLSFTEELNERLKEYRFGEKINSEAEAVRLLLEKALKEEGY